MARRWYLLYPVGPEVHRQALGFAGFSRYGLGRNGSEVITSRPVAVAGTGRAVDKGECQISGSQRGYDGSRGRLIGKGGGVVV